MPLSTSPDPGRHWVDAFDGARLAARRQALGWSQARLAEALQALHADAAAEAVVGPARSSITACRRA